MRVTVPRRKFLPGIRLSEAGRPVNYIDREVFDKLKRLNIVPSDLADDAAFLRRVTIDTIGRVPTPDEVRAFLAEKGPDKRARKIDQLLAHPIARRPVGHAIL